MNADQSAAHARIMSLWGIQESLLQAYRAIFITSQTLFISLAFLYLPDPTNIEGTKFALVVLALSSSAFLGIGNVMISVWKEVCEARGRAVSCVQAMALIVESGERMINDPVNTLKEFQADEDMDTHWIYEHEIYEKRLSSSFSRKKMETTLPLSFRVAWSVYLLVALGYAAILWMAIQ